jgi:hypothetical protein
MSGGHCLSSKIGESHLVHDKVLFRVHDCKPKESQGLCHGKRPVGEDPGAVGFVSFSITAEWGNTMAKANEIT